MTKACTVNETDWFRLVKLSTKAIPTASPQVRSHFTLVDQVNQERGFMARLLSLCSLPRTNSGNQKEAFVALVHPRIPILAGQRISDLGPRGCKREDRLPSPVGRIGVRAIECSDADVALRQKGGSTNSAIPGTTLSACGLCRCCRRYRPGKSTRLHRPNRSAADRHCRAGF